MRALSLLATLALALSPPACGTGDCTESAFHPIDRERKCLYPAVQSCGTPGREGGPRAVVCSIEPGGSMYLSREGHTYPDARRCTSAEEADVELSKLDACP